MPTYDTIESFYDGEFVDGTSDNDSIEIYGNSSTVDAGNGSDVIYLSSVGKNILVEAGSGNDSIDVRSAGSTIIGDSGNDTIKFSSNRIYADGGEGNDVFHLDSYYYDLSGITITSGIGNDTINIVPDLSSSDYISNKLEVVVTDFSSNDALRLDDDLSQYDKDDYSYRLLNYRVENGNVVISDSYFVPNYKEPDNIEIVEPLFSVTLQGISDISQIANANFYQCDYYGIESNTTFEELFDDIIISKSESSTSLTTATNSVSGATSTVPTSYENLLSEVVNLIYNLFSTTFNGDVYLMPSNNGTILVGSSVAGGVTNVTEIDVSGKSESYVYSGGYKVISNYRQGEVINLLSDYIGIDVRENNFLVNSSSGSLIIPDSRDKFIGYSGVGNDVVAYSYLGGNGGSIDGRVYSQAEIMIGADYADNQIYSGNGGSSVWGGNGGNDVLTGGDGYDEFFYAIGSGNDVIQNANSMDMINLLGISLNQISAYSYDDSHVSLYFIDGGSLRVDGNTNVTYLVENQRWICNQATGEWHNP